MNNLFLLLVIFQLKHFVADYILQNKYMLGKKNMRGWALPLFAHCFVHGFFTFAIVMGLVPRLFWLAFVDMAVHFVVDRIKASPFIFGRLSFRDNMFWWVLGSDQMLHHLTHYLIIFMILSSGVVCE